MKKISFLFLLFLIFFRSLCVFSESSVISPVEGTFSNLQSLILNLEEGDEAYYSFSSTDPSVSGLSYDSPVIIDRTGSVNIRIVILTKDGKRIDRDISYTVKTASVSVEKNVQLFLSAFKLF